MPLREGLLLASAYHARVWGGDRLQPGSQGIGEAWVVYEQNEVVGGRFAGRTLAALADEYGAALLGQRTVAQGGTRFPLLIKLLDAHAWLSVQVHPNDAQAAELVGPGQLGKTEAWHILEAAPGAQVICGLRPGTTRDDLVKAIHSGTVTELAQYLTITTGDTLFIAAGTIHALGPGLLLYEVQQTSDITYRVYDWDRPQSAGRQLHLAQSLAVTDPTISGQVQPRPMAGNNPALLVQCPYFSLTQISGTVTGDTAGVSFHALTVVEGTALVSGDGWRHQLGRFASVVVPADCGRYTVTPDTDSRVLLACVP